MKNDSIVKGIRNYVILKLTSGEWHSNYRVPSENTFALKFNCSRLTARTALLPFVHNGVMESRQGSGYIISDNFHLFESTAKKYHITSTSATTIPAFKLPTEITKLINTNDLKHIFYFQKEYFIDDQKMIIQFSQLNKNEVLNPDMHQIEISLIKFLIYYGISPSHFFEHVFFTDYQPLAAAAKSFGYEGSKYPLVLSILRSEMGLIELSLKLIHPSIFAISNSMKIIN